MIFSCMNWEVWCIEVNMAKQAERVWLVEGFKMALLLQLNSHGNSWSLIIVYWFFWKPAYSKVQFDELMLGLWLPFCFDQVCWGPVKDLGPEEPLQLCFNGIKAKCIIAKTLSAFLFNFWANSRLPLLGVLSKPHITQAGLKFETLLPFVSPGFGFRLLTITPA